MKAIKISLFIVVVVAVSLINVRQASPVDSEHSVEEPQSVEKAEEGKTRKIAKSKAQETSDENSEPVTTETSPDKTTKGQKSSSRREIHASVEETTTTSTTVVEGKSVKNDSDGHKKNVTGRTLTHAQANHVRELLKQSNPFRNLMNTDIKWLGQMSDMRLDTIAVPAALFKKSFWMRLSEETNIPIPQMKQMFGIDFDNVKVSDGNYMVDLTEERPEGDYINMGALSDFLIQHNVNTRKLFTCLGVNPDVFTIAFEDEIVNLVSQLFDLLKVPFKYGESYVEKVYHETADVALRSLESFAKFSPSTYIDKNVEVYKNEAVDYADKTALKTSQELSAMSQSSSQLASGALGAAREVLTLPAAQCSKSHPCHRNIDMSSVGDFGNSAVETYNSLAPYAASAYDTSVQLAHRLGDEMGPASTAYTDLTSKTMYSMTMDESSKIFKVPYVLFFADGTFMDRVLTMPQLLVDVGGDNYKPTLMVADPLIRYSRYLFTGEFEGSLNAGVNTDVDIAAKILGDERPEDFVVTRRVKREERVERSAEPKTGIAKELQMVREYDGKVPKGGYKHNFKLKGNHSTIVGRMLNAPAFLSSAGGDVYSSTATALSPFMDTFEILVYSNDPYFVKIQNVEKTLDAAPVYVLPAASIVKGVYPVVDLLFGVTYGEVGLVQIGLKVPTVVTSLGNVVFDLTYKDPVRIAKTMFQYTPGDGGVMSMASLPYSPQFQPTDEGILPEDVPVMGRGTRAAKAAEHKSKSIVNVYEPAASFVTQISSGLLGNVLNPAKVKQSGLINFKHDPVSSFIKLMLNPSAMFKLASDRNLFLQVVLGGQNPKKLLDIGINAEKILDNDIDPARLLVGGIMMLPEEKRTSLGTRENPNTEQLQNIGIDDQKLRKVNVNYGRFLDDGLMSGDDDLLKNNDVDTFLLINRLMRNSVINQFKFLNFGLDFRKFLSAGLRPDYLFAAGLQALETKILQKYQVNPSSLETLNNIGINALKINAKNISLESLLKNGLRDFTESEAQIKFGVSKKKLMKSIFAGLDNTTVVDIGIDVVKLIKTGYKPLSFITGIPEFLKSDEKTLLRHGIDKQKLNRAKIDFNQLMKNGITSKMFIQFYRRDVNLQYLTLSVLSTWGLDQLVADSGSPLSVTVNVASASTKIVAKPGAVGRSLKTAVNMSEWDPTGKYTKMLKSTVKKFTGEETNEANTILLFNSYLQGNQNYKKLLNLGNAVRIIAGRENASDITNPFDAKTSTLQELNSLYADLPPPTQRGEPERKRSPGFWG